jgi:hypothetical protein
MPPYNKREWDFAPSSTGQGNLPRTNQMLGDADSAISAVRKRWGNLQNLQGQAELSDISSGFEMPEWGSSFQQGMRDSNLPGLGHFGQNRRMTDRNMGFGLGSPGGGDGGGGGGDDFDYLGWAQVGTGLLQGAGGIMDYFKNMRGLELTEDAINKKYAAADRDYLGRATTADNIIGGRKDFITKTHANPNSNYLQYINRPNTPVPS